MLGPPRDAAPAVPMSAVLSLFGITEDPVGVHVVEGGWSHQVWRVQTGGGTFAVKQLRREHGEWWSDQLEGAARFELAAWAVGTIPMAEPLAVEGTGGLLGELPHLSPEHVYKCHRWVEGTPCAGDPPSVDRSRQVGATAATLATLLAPSGTTADQLQWNALDAFEATVGEARARSMRWAEDLASLAPRVARLRTELAELAGRAEPLHFAHRDFDPKNAAANPDGRVVLFDWDYAGPRLASSEILDVAISFGGGLDALDDDCVMATLDAYREADGPGRDFARAAPLIVDESFRWLMLNTWRALGHRNITDDQVAFAESLVPPLISTWPTSADLVYRTVQALTDR